MIDETNIVKSAPIAALVETRNRILVLVQDILNKQEEITQLSTGTIADDLWWDIRGHGYNAGHFDLETATKVTDKKFWRFIVQSSQLSRAMSEKAKADLDKKIDEEPPEFSQAEIEMYAANLDGLYASNGAQTIKEVYRALIGCKYWSGHLTKEDNLQKVKPIFHCRWQIRWDAYFKTFRADSWYGQDCKYEDLLTACYLLDTGIKPDYAATFKALAGEQFNEGPEVITPYFTVLAYKNGNQKVTWSKDKLHILDDLNKYGSDGTRLPGTLSKKYKPEHFTV